MPSLRWVLGIVLAVALPPASVALTRGFGAAFVISLVLAIAGPLVFRYLYAGPGLGLCALAVLQAVVLAVRPRAKTLAVVV
jgi:uncharacterized membrane protein YqaE (UPF0057 family)